MATAEPTLPVNGSYAPQTFDAMANNYTASNANNTTTYGATQQNQTSGNNTTSEIPKDEVGWYFVEQYYTTLSKSPEKLYVRYLVNFSACLANITGSCSTTSGLNSCQAPKRTRFLCALARRYVYISIPDIE